LANMDDVVISLTTSGASENIHYGLK
jgi:hypothetical protein